MSEEQDGIEERAVKYVEGNVGDWEFATDSAKAWYFADFARTETATLTDERNRLRDALRELCEAPGATPSAALAKAKALLSEE